MKHKGTSAIDKTTVRDALVRVADEYYSIETRWIPSNKNTKGANLAKRLRLLSGKYSYHDVKGWLFDHRFLGPKTRERKFQVHTREYTLEELKWILKTVNLTLLLVRFYQAERASNAPKLVLKIYNALEFLYPRFAYHIGIIGAKTEAV